MALPDNSHHVHSDGYYSDRGDPDPERMLIELSDEIEQLDGVLEVTVDRDTHGPYIVCDHDCSQDTVESVVAEVDGWGCDSTDHGEWIEIRP